MTLNVTMLDDDVVIHIVKKMYKSDWFSEDTMMNWEEIPDSNKTWNRHQFTWMQKDKNKSRLTVLPRQIYICISVIESKAHQEAKECHKHIKQVTDQNTLLTFVQQHQRKIKDLLLQSKMIMDIMSKDKAMQGLPYITTRQSRENHWYKYCKAMTNNTRKNCFSLEVR